MFKRVPKQPHHLFYGTNQIFLQFHYSTSPTLTYTPYFPSFLFRCAQAVLAPPQWASVVFSRSFLGVSSRPRLASALTNWASSAVAWLTSTPTPCSAPARCGTWTRTIPAITCPLSASFSARSSLSTYCTNWTSRSCLTGEDDDHIYIKAEFIAMCAVVCKQHFSKFIVSPAKTDMQVDRIRPETVVVCRDSNEIAYGNHTISGRRRSIGSLTWTLLSTSGQELGSLSCMGQRLYTDSPPLSVMTFLKAIAA